MEFRTRLEIVPADRKIACGDKVMFIGSCFSISVGERFVKGHFPVLINPSGTVYNPVSVATTLNSLISGNDYTPGDLCRFNSEWLSFDHYTGFSGPDPVSLLARINDNRVNASGFLKQTGFLFVTFGTARVYRWSGSGRIVSNCHKLPASEFTRELLKPPEIIILWNDLLDRLSELFPGLKVIFTISPIRHWKDGAFGNQVSKSVLFLAVEELLKHKSNPGYFPSYEIVMDDLRDYRFYAGDMLHLNEQAVDYIWEAFMACYFEEKTRNIWNEAEGITRAMSHRIRPDSGEKNRQFAERILSKIDSLSKVAPDLKLDDAWAYFRGLLKG